MAIVIGFVCGHSTSREATDTTDVACPQCGNRRVRFVNAPRPTVRVVDCEATSPLAVKE